MLEQLKVIFAIGNQWYNVYVWKRCANTSLLRLGNEKF